MRENKMELLQKEKWKEFTPQDIQKQKNQFKITLMKAYKSPLYRELWKTNNFKPEKIENLDNISQIPFLSKEKLFEGTRRKLNAVCIDAVNQWFLGDDHKDVHEWFPFSTEDFMGISPMLARMSNMVGLKKGDVVLAIVDTPPRISSFLPYLWSNGDISQDYSLEFIIGSMEWYDSLGMSWLNFIQRRRPNAIFTSTANAKVLAEKIGLIKSSIKTLLSEVRIGIFYGQQQKLEMFEISELYSHIEPFEIFSPTEHMSFCSECNNHNGVHLWLDKCIPEILPNGQKEAQLIANTASGVKGELILTNFSGALPLIRYKTGKPITVVSSSQCDCGCTHPRVKFN